MRVSWGSIPEWPGDAVAAISSSVMASCSLSLVFAMAGRVLEGRVWKRLEKV
jgi:hypothetical protein